MKVASVGKKRDIADLMRKVKELAERGVDGEQENARALLQKLIDKYGPFDIETEKEELHTFKYTDTLDARLLSQVIYAVTGKSARGVTRQRRLKERGCYCTEREAIEIETQFAFYRAHMLQDLDLFIEAFVNINHIFPVGNESECVDDMSDERRARALRMFAMMKGMDAHTPTKLIEA